MIKFIRILLFSMVCFHHIEVSYAEVIDLKADWSNANNPNINWSYNEGVTPLPAIIDWPLINGLNDQPAWSPVSFLPAWFKSTNDNPESLDFLTDDIVVHSTGDANIRWTSDVNGNYIISGNVWMARDINRSNDWSLLINDVAIVSGVISDGDIYNRDMPFNFSQGQGNSSLLNNVQIESGDIIELKVIQSITSSFGDYVGVNLSIKSISMFNNGFE